MTIELRLRADRHYTKWKPVERRTRGGGYNEGGADRDLVPDDDAPHDGFRRRPSPDHFFSHSAVIWSKGRALCNGVRQRHLVSTRLPTVLQWRSPN